MSVDRGETSVEPVRRQSTDPVARPMKGKSAGCTGEHVVTVEAELRFRITLPSQHHFVSPVDANNILLAQFCIFPPPCVSAHDISIDSSARDPPDCGNSANDRGSS